MTRETFSYTHGDTGTEPSSSLDFAANERPNPQNFDWYWYNVIEAINGHASEFDRLDSDNDGIVDEANEADTLDGNHASAFADSGHTHTHSELTSVGSSDHHTRYADSEALNAIETGDVDHVSFSNIESVSDGQIGRDNSIGFLGAWGGNGNAVLWDSYNVQTGTNINVSGGTGNESNPQINLDNTISLDKINLGRDGLKHDGSDGWMEIDGGSSGLLVEYYNEQELRLGNSSADVSINGYGPVVSADQGNEGYHIEKNGSDANGVINFKT